MLRYEYRQQMFQIVRYDKLIRLYIKRPVSLSLSKTRAQRPARHGSTGLTMTPLKIPFANTQHNKLNQLIQYRSFQGHDIAAV
jgi:hypothetical protein